MAVKLITNEEYRFGQKNILPELGEVDISEVGIVEVPEGQYLQAEILVGLNIGWSYAGEIPTTTTTTTTMAPETISPKAEVNELGKSANDSNDIGNSGDEDEEKKAMIASLSEKTLEELQGLAKPFKPVAEWKKLDQKELLEYLAKKLV